MKQPQSQPLLELAEGRDQDDRAAVVAAFKRVQASHRRREITNHHVLELLTYVLRHDRDGRGIQLSYDDIANLLDCERSTARTIVRRADEVFGLLAIYEDRYTRGGQAPNRYSIDRQAVARINSPVSDADSARSARSPARPSRDMPENMHRQGPGGATIPDQLEADAAPGGTTPPGGGPAATRAHPGATRMHPPATRAQGVATRVHPYKEDTLSSTLSSTLISNSAAAKAAAAEFERFDVEDWGEVARRASMLAKRRPALDREFVWDVCAVAELLDRGMAADLVRRVIEGRADHPRVYLDSAMREECKSRSLDWRQLRQHVPRPDVERTEVRSEEPVPNQSPPSDPEFSAAEMFRQLQGG